ncbi:MAG: ribosome biogenesis GTP-binding protein YihA/YsxC [Candidatus Binatia bacterium]
MKVRSAEFIASATSPRSLPPARGPEVAIVGRSNVGKSSLINGMTGRRKLARTSKTPGCTDGLLFFLINEEMILVDFPGYGYASRSLARRRAWKTLVEGYLSSRQELVAVLILVDVRRGPELDEEQLADFLSAHDLPYLWVLTKCDKLSRTKLDARIRELRERFGQAPTVATSARKGTGLQDLWHWMSKACEATTATQGERW